MKYTLLTVLLTAIVFAAGCGSSSADATGNHDASGPITEARLGVKIYPGATIVTSGETDEVVSANLRTPDSVDKVIAFYEAELGVKATGDVALYELSGQKGGKKYGIGINNDGNTNVSIMGKK
jgi:hypothetical protein